MNSELRSQLAAKRCVNLPKGSPSLPSEQVTRLLEAVPDWKLSGKGIEREYKLPSYLAGVRLFSRLAEIADREDHHPDALIKWRRVKLSLWTHTADGLSENDFILAAKCEVAFEEFLREEGGGL